MTLPVSWLATWHAINLQIDKGKRKESKAVFWVLLYCFPGKFGRKMESANQKSLERVVSQKALQMGSSFPCQICVVGFLCGICLTSLFLAALTSLGSFEFGGISFGSISTGISPQNSSSRIISELTKPVSYLSLVPLLLSCHAFSFLFLVSVPMLNL